MYQLQVVMVQTIIIKSILDEGGKKTAQIGTLGLKAEGVSHEFNLTTPDAISIQELFSNT